MLMLFCFGWNKIFYTSQVKSKLLENYVMFCIVLHEKIKFYDEHNKICRAHVERCPV
jgi:hypothetical protein